MLNDFHLVQGALMDAQQAIQTICTVLFTVVIVPLVPYCIKQLLPPAVAWFQ